MHLVILFALAAAKPGDEINAQFGENLQNLKAVLSSGNAKIDEEMKETDNAVKKEADVIEARKKALASYHGGPRPEGWPSSLVQTGEKVSIPKPTSLLEADARVADGMKELDKVLSFDELDDKPASSLIELPGLAQQKEKFEAARQKLHMVQQSIADDSKRMQENARRAASSLMEAPSSLMETQSREKARMLALSKASQGVQSWAATIANKQNNFIKKMMNHGVEIPPRLREAIAQDQAFSLIQAQSKPTIMDKIPVENINPHMVDDQMKAVEHRLRHDAQIFQEEADSGRRPILPGSFLQTRDPDDDDTDADDAKIDAGTADEPPSPVKQRFDDMKQIRKELRGYRDEFAKESASFTEGTRKAKAEFAQWKQRHQGEGVPEPDEQPSSFLETAPEDDKLAELGQVGKSLHDLDMNIRGQKARWASAKDHARQRQEESSEAYKKVLNDFKKQFHPDDHPAASFLQTGNGATLSELLNDQDAESATSALNEWKSHLDSDRKERTLSHRALEKDLAFKAADFGPELLDKYENGGRMSFLQESDQDPGMLAEQLATIEQKARNHAADIIGAPVDDSAGSLAETSALADVSGTDLPPEDKPEAFQGVLTPGVINPDTSTTDTDAVNAEGAATAEAAAKADEKAVAEADSAEKAEEQAAEAAEEKADKASEKEDDQLRKQK